MADEGNIISNLNVDGPVPNGEDTSPAIGLISQYVKDLSVENPNAPESYQWSEAPDIAVDFNISARVIQPEIHEIELKINVPDDQAHPFLFAEGPRILFPFARRIVADAVRDAGYPPLMLEPIDFNGLYMQQLAQAQATAEATPAGQA